MKVEQKIWNNKEGWKTINSSLTKETPQLIFCFGDRLTLDNKNLFSKLKEEYPESHLLIVSTAGNILDVRIFDNSLTTTAIFLESSTLKISKINIREVKDSQEAGKQLANQLPTLGLKHALIFSDGHLVNGSDLIKGITSILPKQVALTGGLAGDDERFEKTLVGIDSPPIEGEIVLIGFYGENLRFGFGSRGGWDSFGVERTITRSDGNILYELDGKPVLELYKKYLQDYVKELPGSALLFPLAIRMDDKSEYLVRSILSIDEKNHSMTFAGDIPQGWKARLMKANFDRLVDGAYQAATNSYQMMDTLSPDLALLISCVGRRIVLDQRTEDEIESVREVIGTKTNITGFYSYGEICPTIPNAGCDLHNQTMTITTITELPNV